MEWIQSILNAENGSPVQLITITICIVVLLILITWVFRKIAGTAARRNARNRIPRLSVTDWTSVGEKHQLVLVRRDNVEHLLLIGGNSDVVVENNIVRVQPTSRPAPASTSQPTPASSEASPAKAEAAENSTSVVTPAVAATAAAVAAVAVTPETPKAEASVELDVTDEPDLSTPDVEEAVVENATPKVDVEPTSNTAEFENDLIASITDTIEDEVKPAETPAAEAEPQGLSEGKGEDEMQRLLDELAGEAKEAATAKEPA